MNDPIVNEIRKFRDEHAKSFNYDIKAICKDYRQKHSLYIEKLSKIKRQENANKSVQRTGELSVSP
jgi:hypothetical protein